MCILWYAIINVSLKRFILHVQHMYYRGLHLECITYVFFGQRTNCELLCRSHKISAGSFKLYKCVDRPLNAISFEIINRPMNSDNNNRRLYRIQHNINCYKYDDDNLKRFLKVDVLSTVD